MASQTAKKSLLKGAPGWMVTFADLMELLVALFVLILSFADFDEDGFAKKSDSIAKAFNAERDSIFFTRLQLGTSMSDTPRDDCGDHDLEWIFQTLDALELVLATEIRYAFCASRWPSIGKSCKHVRRGWAIYLGR